MVVVVVVMVVLGLVWSSIMRRGAAGHCAVWWSVGEFGS
jgi:hypothetical protein